MTSLGKHWLGELLIYELHAKRFTDLNIGTLTPLGVLTDELKPTNRRVNRATCFNFQSPFLN